MPRRLRLFARPRCGDNAILWKERYATPPGKLGRLLGIPITVVTGLLLSWILLEFAVVAFKEAREYGYYLRRSSRATRPFIAGVPSSRNRSKGTPREELMQTIRSATIALSVLWMLAVAGSAAGSITSEQEEDTWISLVSTTLTGPEIIRAKMLVPLRRFARPRS